MDEFKINIRIDDRVDSYTGYLPDGWLNEPPFNVVKKGCVLYRLLDWLGLAWRTTGYIASVPSTMVKVCQSSTLGYAKVKSPDASILAFGDEVLRKVSRRVPELVEDSKLRSRLMEALVTEADALGLV